MTVVRGQAAADRQNGGAGTTTTTERPLRIGEVAELVGTTPRTIRYYEEIGLLPGSAERAQGKHRCYSARDVEQLRRLIRLKDLLGLSLEQLSTLLEAESARAELRREWEEAEDPSERCRILDQALSHIDTQLELVRGRRRELEQFERELDEKRAALRRRRDELGKIPAVNRRQVGLRGPGRGDASGPGEASVAPGRQDVPGRRELGQTSVAPGGRRGALGR